MRHGFYFKFFEKTHNEVLSVLISEITYFFYCVLFLIKKAVHKKDIVKLASKTAVKNLEKVHPDMVSEPVYQNPKIDSSIDLSIVIPVYNYVHLIEKNILSIINQKTKYRFETIFIDDGSTDGAKDVLKKYKDYPNVKVIFQENMGIAGARNTGINNASGKYLMFVDCDDEVHNDMVEKLLSKALDGDYDIVMGAHNLVKESNGKIISVLPNVYPQFNLMRYKNNDEIMNYAGLPWCKVYKRELWNKVRFFPGYWYEDTIVQMLIFPQCHKFAYIPEVLYEYRWYENNFSHTQNNAANVKSIDRYWLLMRILDRYKNLDLKYDEMFYTLLIRHLSLYYYNSFCDLDKKLVNSLFVLACDIIREYKPNKDVKLPYILKQTEKAMLSNDIELWKLTISYQ